MLTLTLILTLTLTCDASGVTTLAAADPISGASCAASAARRPRGVVRVRVSRPPQHGTAAANLTLTLTLALALTLTRHIKMAEGAQRLDVFDRCCPTAAQSWLSPHKYKQVDAP